MVAAYSRKGGQKTSTMKMMEVKANDLLEDFILRQLGVARGDATMVAKSMNLHRSTLGRWIERLGIRAEANEVRILHGRSPSTVDPQFTVGIHSPKITARDAMRLEVCPRCHSGIEDHNGVVSFFDRDEKVVMQCPEEDKWTGATRVKGHTFQWK